MTQSVCTDTLNFHLSIQTHSLTYTLKLQIFFILKQLENLQCSRVVNMPTFPLLIMTLGCIDAPPKGSRFLSFFFTKNFALSGEKAQTSFYNADLQIIPLPSLRHLAGEPVKPYHTPSISRMSQQNYVPRVWFGLQNRSLSIPLVQFGQPNHRVACYTNTLLYKNTHQNMFSMIRYLPATLLDLEEDHPTWEQKSARHTEFPEYSALRKSWIHHQITIECLFLIFLHSRYRLYNTASELCKKSSYLTFIW